ncbi:hypothetical protein IM538_10840 [Cytobacillus suaedae]|nr:hypothetical protein IM538_10840 [Cytobacillus suaedae]
MDSKVSASKIYSKFQWFLFVIVIPVLFTVTLALVLLTIAGVNVFEYSKVITQNTPILSNYVSSDENAVVENRESVELQISSLEGTIQEKEEQIAELEKNLEEKESEINSLQEELLYLEEELLVKEEQETYGKTIAEISKMYETMSPKNAAVIIPKLDNDEALSILSVLKTETVSKILEKMDPEDAAKYTQLLTE